MVGEVKSSGSANREKKTFLRMHESPLADELSSNVHFAHAYRMQVDRPTLRIGLLRTVCIIAGNLFEKASSEAATLMSLPEPKRGRKEGQERKENVVEESKHGI